MRGGHHKTHSLREEPKGGAHSRREEGKLLNEKYGGGGCI